MFGKDFVVMVEYDETKVLEEMVFFSILIWARAMEMPLGEMNKVTGVAIGREVGEFLEMEVEDDGTIVEQFLQIKVRLNIRKPLMRGMTLVESFGVRVPPQLLLYLWHYRAR
jgi:hypothetical protein